MNRPSTVEPHPAGAPLATRVPGTLHSGRAPGGRAGLTVFLQRNEGLLWWFHSFYALLFGVLAMWLGSRNFTVLRIVVFYIAFIWLSSLFLPAIGRLPRLSTKWRSRVRLVINYFNKNFYQQLLFFVLPLYYSSATFGSANIIFVGLLAASAVLSTLDVVYDRYISERWPLTAVFFAFNLFACINVILPVLWRISNYWSLWISSALALAGFMSILHGSSGRSGSFALRTLLLTAAALAVMVMFLRGFIPPAPLGLVKAEFGRSAQALSIVDPLKSLPSSSGRIVALTAIRAPLGLHERVRHSWYVDGKRVYASPFYAVTGGRERGFRIWTQISGNNTPGASKLVLDVETVGGQLIGRARLTR